MKSGTIATLVGGGIVALLLLFTIFGSFYTVNEGERGVVKYLGAVVGVAEPGFNWKMPWLADVPTINIRVNTSRWENLQSYTRDQQVATSTISVNWHVDQTKIIQIYKTYGSAENLAAQALNTRVGEQLETVFGQYNADNAVANRAKLSADYATAIKQAQDNYPIIIDAVQIENFDLPKEYEDRINEKMAAEVEVKKLEQKALQAKQEAEVTVTQANAAAAAQVAQATAQATATELAGKAEASAIQAKGDAQAEVIAAKGKALTDNPQLVELTKAERWDGKLPSTVIPGNATPFFTVPSAPTSPTPAQ